MFRNWHLLSVNHKGWLFFFFNFNWSIVDWQCCASLCCTAVWFTVLYTHIHSFLNILFHYGWSQETGYSCLCYTVGPVVYPFYIWASLMAQRLKRLPPVQETRVWSLGREDPLEKEMVTHSSILAWRIPWTEKPGRLQFFFCFCFFNWSVVDWQCCASLCSVTQLYTHIHISIHLLTPASHPNPPSAPSRWHPQVCSLPSTLLKGHYFILCYDWVVVHCTTPSLSVYVPHLLYTLTCKWILRVFLGLGYRK